MTTAAPQRLPSDLPPALARALALRLQGLRARVVLRGAAIALMLTASCVVISVLMLELLPRYVLGWTPGSGVGLAAGCAAGLTLACYALRRETWPRLQEAALWLEAAGHGNAALATAVSVPGQGPFMGRVSQEALGYLQQSDRFEARPILPLHVLVGAPVSLLAALLLSFVVLASSADSADTPAQQAKASRAYSAVDVGADRDAEDVAALQQAMRLQKAAATARDQAANVRAAGSTEEAQKALDAAREALRASGESSMAAGAAIDSVPEQVGKTAQDREAAAKAIEAAAASLESSAALAKAAGTRDTGKAGGFDVEVESPIYAPLPALAHQGEVVTTELATQSAARRALAARARDALRQ